MTKSKGVESNDNQETTGYDRQWQTPADIPADTPADNPGLNLPGPDIATPCRFAPGDIP